MFHLGELIQVRVTFEYQNKEYGFMLKGKLFQYTPEPTVDVELKQPQVEKLIGSLIQCANSTREVGDDLEKYVDDIMQKPNRKFRK